jgi:ABC-type multidrug transport system fused ATPase/permease subunit
MRIFGRMFLIPLGIIVAAIFAGLFLIISGFAQPSLGGALVEAAMSTMRQLMQSLFDDGQTIDRFSRLASGVTSLTTAVLFLPVALVAAVSEVFGLRFWMLQALLAAALTAVLPFAMLPELMTGHVMASPITGLLAATGALSGSIYWMIAGRSAGSEPKSVEERATVKAPVIRK